MQEVAIRRVGLLDKFADRIVEVLDPARDPFGQGPETDLLPEVLPAPAPIWPRR